MARLAIDDYNPDIVTIICCNDSFQRALDHNTIKILLRVCKRARPLLSSKVPRFHRWYQSMELLNPDGQMRVGLTPSDEIAISLHCDDPVTADRSWLEDNATDDRSWLVAQADHGNTAASYFLARVLQSEIGVQRYLTWFELNPTPPRIFYHLKNAAEGQHSMAQFHLAQCYRNGIGVEQSPAKAVELYRSLADRGMAQAQVALGGCFEGGEGVEQDYTTAIGWYSKAADQGNEDGRLHIMFLRGWLSFIGHGVEQSDKDAFQSWQETSTQSTNPVVKPIATHMVGWMHYLGRGTMRDEKKGIKMIRENRSNEFPLGEGECLTPSYWGAMSNSPAPRKFFNLCQLGSDRDWLCRHLMALCMLFGFGTTPEVEKAAGIFEHLANQGHSDSQLWIGDCYYHGLGVTHDKERGFQWYSNSANQGNSYGQWMVGHCYYHGSGVPKDYAKAVEWFRKSAEQDNRYAQGDLGECYKHGRGVPQNIDSAVFWYRKSADQGFDFAIAKLNELGL
ncbi:uncharacterized protein BJ171DRAFT_599109 [Polychytrium aggregatum]|uniref:uncharacterized protein n=1 Tax=Polychytrium aggregatum TaxID=110093 RepID=UPI0022FDF21C|nr:uncharacterized protein BJ171DRAFT_599109 [Polychytrium aggregatum]KAI9204706.1 hypothetical protein BJ171DRAFT_599109 [Polychytrium aggregatum]